MSFGGNYYVFIIFDDYLRYTWTLFLVNKNDAFSAFNTMAKIVQNEKDSKVTSIRSDHGGGEFENEHFQRFCEES